MSTATYEAALRVAQQLTPEEQDQLIQDLQQIRMATEDAPAPSSSSGLLTEYIEAAMTHAQYETLEDTTVYGEIAGLSGVWGNGATQFACADDLRDALEGWIVLGLRLGHTLPIIDGIDLNITAATA